MRQKSNSILDSLKKLYIKMTGKKIIKRKTECDVLSDIAEEYVPAEDIVKEYMSKVYEYKGSVASYSALPTEDVDTGDVYNVLDTGKNYAWTGTEWDNLGGASLIFTTDITQLTTSQLNELKAGDIVIKQTGTQNHTYIVTYQEYLHGICLTYTDASTVETVSYDYVDSNWVYNSTDIKNLTSLVPVVANPTLAGTEGNLESIEINGTKYKAGGSSELYMHIVEIYDSTSKVSLCFNILRTSPTLFTKQTFMDYLLTISASVGDRRILCSGYIGGNSTPYKNITICGAAYQWSSYRIGGKSADMSTEWTIENFTTATGITFNTFKIPA